MSTKSSSINYKEYYQCKAMPFAHDSDLKFIFLGQNYEIPLAMLVSGLDKGIQLHGVHGEDGVGKTTFVKYVYKHIQHSCSIGFIDKRIESSSALLTFVLESFGQKAKNAHFSEMLEQLRFFLTVEFTTNHNQPSLLIIDDVHKMPPEVLKTINSLLTLNGKNSLLLQLILVGSDDLQEILNQTISRKVEKLWRQINALTAQETKNYIHHRLKIAGTTAENLFNQQVCTAIHDYSTGIPQKINSLSHRLLLFSSTHQINSISSVQIRQIINEEKPNINLIPPRADGAAQSSSWLFNEGWKTGLMVAGFGLALGYILNPFLVASEQPQITVPKTAEIKSDSNKQNPVTTTLAKSSGIATESHKKALTPRLKPLNRLKNRLSYDKQQVSKSNKGSAKNNKVEKLLAVAEQQISASKLLTPTEDNAYKTYTSILSTNPHNKRAILGLQRIADRYLTLAKKKFIQEEFLQSKIFIARGLKASSGHKELVSLSKEIDSKLEILEHNQQIQILVKQGNQQLADLKIISPINDSAYQSFLEIFTVDKSNQQAKQGMKKIQRLLNSQLQETLDKKQYNSAKSIIRQVLSLPNNEYYLEETVTSASQTEKLINDKIATLSTRAKQQLNSRQLFYPVGNNATETYRKILRIDRAHAGATKGLADIEEQYRTLAKNALAKGKTKRALIYANEAVKAFPDDSNLLELQSSISSTLSEQNAESAGSVVSYNRHTEFKKQLRPFGNF